MSRQVSQLLIVVVAIANAAFFIGYQRPDWTTQWGDQHGYLMLGRALAEAGRLADARAAFDRAVMLDPNNAQARQDLDLVKKASR